ncbi:aminodeoxychorismate synthase component I [Thalassotalea euphylliae]|uniref:aminodeoxychorismate synthase component I n=1 Tax=Thalassotalea euphylliae TaxID=1655234 RepID=UPI003639F060
MLIKRLESLDSYKPLNVFEPFSGLPWSIWLDSSDSVHPNAKFDIIAWQPVACIETTGRHTTVSTKSSGWAHLNQTSDDDPLAVLKSIERDIFQKHPLSSSELPFNGGAIGYFSYDLGRRFEKLPVLAENDISMPEMAVGIYLNALLFDNDLQQWWLIAPENEWNDIAANLDVIDVPDVSAGPDDLTPFALTSQWHANMNEAAYANKFAQVQEYLRSGDCYQINLAQRFSASYKGDEFDAYKTLREANKAPFSAFMRFDQTSVLSISPERFMWLSDGKVQTKPIKGTLPRGIDKETDQANAEQLSASTKDRAENLMIVDLLRNDISRVCVSGTVNVPKLFDIESFPAVHHLVSTVEGKLKDGLDGTDLIRASFPGGSITGAPKIRAMEIIEELEPHRRNLYCGSIGYLSACGNMDTSITIRTLICQENKIHCWAGGGLVADSKVSSEYQETFDKVGKILPTLQKKSDE